MAEVEVNDIKGLGSQGKQLVKLIEKNDKNPALNKNDKRVLGNDLRSSLMNDNQILENTQKEKIFNQCIGSIQKTDDHIDIGSPWQPSPKRNNAKTDKLNKHAPKVGAKGGYDDRQQQLQDERDSMVIMGSMNMNKGGAVGPGGKKTSKKITHLGGTANLKKNKLAIAFNNLEVEQNDKDS